MTKYITSENNLVICTEKGVQIEYTNNRKSNMYYITTEKDEFICTENKELIATS